MGAVGLFDQIKILWWLPVAITVKSKLVIWPLHAPSALSLAALNFQCFSLSTDPVISAANALSSRHLPAELLPILRNSALLLHPCPSPGRRVQVLACGVIADHLLVLCWAGSTVRRRQGLPVISESPGVRSVPASNNRQVDICGMNDCGTSNMRTLSSQGLPH